MIGSYLKVYDHAGAYHILRPEEEPRVDAAVSAYIDSGGTRDVLVATEVNGVLCKFLASGVASWMLSTPESRAEGVAWDKAAQDEAARVRQEYGLWDE